MNQAKTIIESAPLFVDDETKAKIEELNAIAHDVTSSGRIQTLQEIMRLKDEHFDQDAARTYVADALTQREPVESPRLEKAKHVGHAVVDVLNTDVTVLAKRLVNRPKLS